MHFGGKRDPDGGGHRRGPSGNNTNTSSVNLVDGLASFPPQVGRRDRLVPREFARRPNSRESLRADPPCATMQGCGVTLPGRRCRLGWTVSVLRCSRSRSMPTSRRAGAAAPG
ncbi:RNA polymerase sigma factor domain protein [Mycobacterium sp. MAC_011194_8550]|nr:RNA polymerase sigma factor domain protein [Mycobacterium sp. MAC_011194_8550]